MASPSALPPPVLCVRCLAGGRVEHAAARESSIIRARFPRLRLSGHPCLGKVRIVVSFEHATLSGRQVVLVTNRLDWNAAKIIRLYLCRWPTETFYQDGKGHLGFHESRMRSAEAIGKHWCLVCVASSLLHLTCLPAGPGRARSLIHTIGDACRQQGRALLQKLLVFVHDQ